MLRQAAKSFLEKQNRLSFSSLQITIRRMQMMNDSEPQLKKGSAYRAFKLDLHSRNVHLTGIQFSFVNDVHLDGGRKDFDKQSNDCKYKDENDDEEDDDDIIVNIKKLSNKDNSQLYDNKFDAESSNIQVIYDSDEDKTMELFSSGEDEEEFFSLEDSTTEKDLMTLQSREVVNKKIGKKNSLMHSQDVYQPKSIIQTLLDEKEALTGDLVSPELTAVEKYDLKQAEKGILKTEDVSKVEIPALDSIAPIVNDSEDLKKFVDLGVSLYYVQKKGMIDHFLQMNFKKDVAPYLFFLKDTGVTPEKFGHVITECPWIFQHSVHNLKVRVDYLRSKKFSKNDVANMINSDPLFLLIPMKRIDAKLGYLQKEFRLTGTEVRKTVSSFPKLIIAKPAIIKEKKFYMKKFLGFNEQELKSILLTFPEAYIRGSERTALIFDYLHNIMELSHELIAKSGESLGTARYILDCRHRYLVKKGRDQYNPTLPNYVSLNDLIVPKDEDFCLKTAKTGISEYNTFLRLI